MEVDFVKLHFLLGIASNMDNSNTFDIAFYGYQFLQLFLENRNEVLEGNNLKHTLDKIGYFITGKIITKGII